MKQQASGTLSNGVDMRTIDSLDKGERVGADPDNFNF